MGMYHVDDHHILTTDEITHLRKAVLYKKDGQNHAILHVQLADDKDYPQEGQGFKLHLTNGVSHRYLQAETKEEEDARLNSLDAQQAEEAERVAAMREQQNKQATKLEIEADHEAAERAKEAERVKQAELDAERVRSKRPNGASADKK